MRSATTEWTFLRLQEDLRWPTIVGRHLYVQAMRTESWGSGVYVLDVETGDPIAEYHGDVEFRGPAAIADGRMYVITPNGAVLALSGIDEIDTFR
ncbi:MAG: hypothetical protein GTN78_09390 [Gemmatimonadales bacterium]|nr:hypothetical protein [Gemmatimonadales bacterium]